MRTITPQKFFLAFLSALFVSIRLNQVAEFRQRTVVIITVLFWGNTFTPMGLHSSGYGIQFQKFLKIPKFGPTKGVIFNSENCKLSWSEK